MPIFQRTSWHIWGWTQLGKAPSLIWLLPTTLLYPWGCREEELGHIPAGHTAGLAQPDPKGLHSESGLWPQGRARRWASQCRGLSWGSQGPQSANKLPAPQEWLQVQSQSKSTVRTKDLRTQSPCPTAPWMPPVLGNSPFLAGGGRSLPLVSPALPLPC